MSGEHGGEGSSSCMVCISSIIFLAQNTVQTGSMNLFPTSIPCHH